MSDQEAQQELTPGDDSGASTSATVERKPAPPVRKPKKLPPFKVLLHNDDENTFEHVVRSIVRLTDIKTEEAVLRTLEAHETGVALLMTTHRERAELYVEQFASLSLTVTAEPA